MCPRHNASALHPCCAALRRNAGTVRYSYDLSIEIEIARLRPTSSRFLSYLAASISSFVPVLAASTSLNQDCTVLKKRVV